MTPFVFLAGVVFFFAVAFISKLKISQKTTSPPPKAQRLHITRNLPKTSPPRRNVKKQRKRRIMCKLYRRGITIKPEFKNKDSAPKIVYMAYMSDSSTIVFVNDLYHTFESKSSWLFEMHVPDVERSYGLSHPLHCKGLVILPAARNTILICNPTTKEILTLPQSSSKHIAQDGGRNTRFGFGFVQSTQVYKVAQFFYRSYDQKERKYNMGFEVFTIGVSTCWRVLDKDPPYPLWKSCWTYTGKCIYFHIWHRLKQNGPNAFVCFDLRNEKFSLLHPPFSLKHINVRSMLLSNLQRSICLSALSANNTKFSVFTTKHGMNKEWVPRFCFNVSVQPRGASIMPIAEYKGSLLTHVIDGGSQRMMSYDSKDGSFEEVNDSTMVDVEMKEDGFKLFLNKPWFSVSCYEPKFM